MFRSSVCKVATNHSEVVGYKPQQSGYKITAKSLQNRSKVATKSQQSGYKITAKWIQNHSKGVLIYLATNLCVYCDASACETFWLQSLHLSVEAWFMCSILSWCFVQRHRRICHMWKENHRNDHIQLSLDKQATFQVHSLSKQLASGHLHFLHGCPMPSNVAQDTVL